VAFVVGDANIIVETMFMQTLEANACRS